MRLKIISEGTFKNTKIINEETGELLENVISIIWYLDVGDLARAELRLVNVPCELKIKDEAK